MILMGIRIHILPDPLPARRVRRTWRQRLFDRPWRPLQAWRDIPAGQRLVALGQAIRLDDGCLVMHQADYDVLSRQLEAGAVPGDETLNRFRSPL